MAPVHVTMRDRGPGEQALTHTGQTQGMYGVDRFRASLHFFLRDRSETPHPHLPPAPMAIEKVTETVWVGPPSGPPQTSVCSLLHYQGFRRHKTEVTIRPKLSPVKYADTVYAYINSTRKRYVSKTFYEARPKPTSYAETTFACPKTKQEVFVTYLDQNPNANRKRFKNEVEISALRFRSFQTLPSPTDINSNSLSTVNQALADQHRLSNGQEIIPNGMLHSNGFVDNGLPNNLEVEEENQNGSLPVKHEPFQEIYDPGASQVYIPQRKDYGQTNGMINGQQQFILDFPNEQNVQVFSNGTFEEDDSEV